MPLKDKNVLRWTENGFEISNAVRLALLSLIASLAAGAAVVLEAVVSVWSQTNELLLTHHHPHYYWLFPYTLFSPKPLEKLWFRP